MELEVCQHFNEQNVTFSLQGKSIYKDQCTKCFDDPKKQEGINLCLKCFNGQCLGNYNHSLNHFQNTGHSIVLNIKDVPVEQEQSQTDQKITKLAIGKEGGALLDGPVFKTEYRLFCYKCNKYDFDCQNEYKGKIEGLIQSVKNSQSQFMKSAVVAWELEVFPCEHTLILEQIPIDICQLNMKNCNNCDLSSNLWLCLTCGNLGCGRKQSDQIGGNSHGIAHYKQTGHPLVVKMGTITAEGDASVYCYQCDNDVKDENIQQHLINFGLDIKQQKKTEKSMQELSLEASLMITLNSIIEEGKTLFPIFGKEYTGLENIGNSCYMNSILQAVFSLSEFKQKYFELGYAHLQQCNRFPPDCYLCQMCKLAHGLLSGDYSIKKEHKPQKDQNDQLIQLQENQKYYQDGIKIVDFKQMIGKDKKEFSGNQMQDSLEYLEHLISVIQKKEKQENLGDTSKIFQFKQITKLKCIQCNGVKIREQNTMQLKFPVRQPTKEEIKEYEIEQQNKNYKKINSDNQQEDKKVEIIEGPSYPVKFQECAQNFFQGEHVEVYCPQCQQNQIFLSQPYFKTLPNYLLVTMQRFVAVNWVPKKLNAMIQIDEDLDLSGQILVEAQLHENIMKDDDKKKSEQNYDKEACNQLQNMGFSQNRCIRALLATNNNVEAASNWIFERMDDFSLDDPIQQQNKDQENNIRQEDIQAITSMGFSEKAARISLKKCDNNVDRAIDYIFSHEDVELEDVPKEEAQQDLPQQGIENVSTHYKLHAAIVHLGSSALAGHYVAYIKKNDKWVLYNDSKVAETPDPVLGKGYLYLFKRV